MSPEGKINGFQVDHHSRRMFSASRLVDYCTGGVGERASRVAPGRNPQRQEPAAAATGGDRASDSGREQRSGAASAIR
jgi:hypothetical protein